MKALSVHGCGALFSSTILRSGLLGQYGPVIGIPSDNGRDGNRSPDEVSRSPDEVEEDIKHSSSASQPPPVFMDDVECDLDEGVDCMSMSMQRGCIGGF